MVNKVLSWINFGVLSFVLLLAPWIFGAWELWWFWSFVIILFLSFALFGARLVADGVSGDEREETGCENAKLKWACLISFIPFFVYALYRAVGSDVYMDAQKSFLLHFTGFLVGVQVVFGFSRQQCKWLFLLIVADLFLLGSYGLINHFVTGNKMVMWSQGFEQYISANRTTGSYYCPDHFAGIMELAMCMCLGLLLSRKVNLGLKICSSILLLMALTGVVLSQSRGGGITVVAIVAGCLVFGFWQWPRAVRWYARLAASAALLLLFLVFCFTCDKYVERFVSYFGWEDMRNRPVAEKREILESKLLTTSRGKMIGGALRAWKSAPWLGIGPGMHQNMWPRYAATSDGNIELGVWPSMLNNDFHSYEVHSDWVQLLQEYGLFGLLLFLIPTFTVLYVFIHELRCERSDFESDEWVSAHVRSNHAAVLAGILAWICMVVHSLGDFNLQMPATIWLLAGIMAIPIGVSQGTLEEEDNV